jgi:chaperone required for assembly of F1-ATPase
MAGRLAPPVELPRRFYKTVSTAPAPGGHGVLLDGKPVKTPAGALLTAPTAALARMLADEWDAQTTHIDTTGMGAVRLASTAIDFMPQARDGVVEEIARYAGSDALCYFAEGPDTLVERQTVRWGAMLDWAARDLQLEFLRVTGIGHRSQPPQTLRAVAELAAREDDFGLAGLAHATALFGSAILGLALRRGELDGDAAHDLARLDEAFQEERWGIDEEAAERTANRLAEARMLDGWFTALRAS